MPAPQKSMLAGLAKLNFCSKAIKIPAEWAAPSTQFNDAFASSERTVAPNPPTNLFLQATLNHYHVKAAKEVGEGFDKYIDGICGAVCDGVDKWMKLATIAGVIVNGPVGMLMAGNVIGPPLGPLILATAPKATPQELKYSNAIANAFSTAWQAWHAGLMGVLSYPAFAAFPGPMAPPTPNIPMPLIAFSSPGEAALAPATLKSAMVGNLGDPTALHSTDLFDALAQAFNTAFLLFKGTTMVQNVLGMGPIPTFVPPFVPAGPVLGGVANGAPGCLN